MIRALAIETSGNTGSVALVEDGAAVAQESFEHGLGRAARIVPAIDALCGARGWTAADVTEIYVSAGPGSFTGLRIGITLAKTLAFATGAKLAAVPSLTVLAQNAPREAHDAEGAGNLIIVLDAKRGQIFTAGFEWDAESATWRERIAAHLGTLKQMLAATPRPVWLLGEGIPYHREAIETGDAGVHVTDEALWRARADVLARLGWEQARRGEFVDPFVLEPIYIRLPEAQEKWEKAERERAG